MAFLPQHFPIPAVSWAKLAGNAESVPRCRLGSATKGELRVNKPRHQTPVRTELSPKSRSRSSRSPHVFGVCSLRDLPQESRHRGHLQAARQRGLGRPRQAHRGRRQGGREARGDRGADAGRHAGDRNLQPALYRERRPLHDGDLDVQFRHRHAEDHRCHLHPRRSSPGDGALRRSEAVRTGREQAVANLLARHHRRDGADGIAGRGDRPLRRHSRAHRRRRRHRSPTRSSSPRASATAMPSATRRS